MSSRAPFRAQQRVVAGAVLLVGTLTAAVTVLASAAQAGGPCGTGYPYAGYGGKTDPNGFYAPDMRSYVAACLNATGSDFARTEKGPNGHIAIFGEPTSWDTTASSIGFAVSSVPAVGLVAQLRTGEVAPLFDAQGHPDGYLRGGDLVGYVDAVYSDGQVLMRTYDSSTSSIRSVRTVTPRYLRLSGGTGIRSTPAPTKTPGPTASTTPTVTPTPSTRPSPTPTPTPTPTPSAKPTGRATGFPSATPSVAPTTPAPVVIANPPATASESLASRYGKLIGIIGLVIAGVLGVIVIVASRRTDDLGD